MASRRIIASGQSALDRDEDDGNTSGTAGKSSVAPAVPMSVIAKLLGFTVAMFAGPIGVYYLTLNTFYNGNSTWAGATAAVTANVVLIAYVIVAMREDESEKRAAEEESKKAR